MEFVQTFLLSKELLYFLVMIAAFIVLLTVAKLPSGLCLMSAALLGAVVHFFVQLFTATDPANLIDVLRYLVEGAFGYLDTILVVITAMVFMVALQASRTMQYLSAVIVKAFRKFPTLLLITLMFIIMFPAMVTGSSLASVITTGGLVAPILEKWGIPKKKVGAIVALGAILGMVAPPINVPAMVICDVVDIPYVDFAMPLCMLAFPVAVVGVLLLGRKYVAPIGKEEVGKVVSTTVLQKYRWTVCLPLIVFVLLVVAEVIFPRIFGYFGMTAMFVVSTVVSFFVGKRRPFYVKPAMPAENGEKKSPPACVLDILRQGVKRAFPAMGLLMGVGMFMEIITWNGVRGYFATLASALYYITPAAGYVSMSLTLPLFGGISAFGSASILGGPFVMMLNGIGDNVIVCCGLSLLAAIGEFLPPTAMSASSASHIVGEKKWLEITKAAWPAIAVAFGYAVLYTVLFGMLVQKGFAVWILLLIMTGVVLVAAIVWEVVCALLAREKGKRAESEREGGQV